MLPQDNIKVIKETIAVIKEKVLMLKLLLYKNRIAKNKNTG